MHVQYTMFISFTYYTIFFISDGWFNAETVLYSTCTSMYCTLVEVNFNKITYLFKIWHRRFTFRKHSADDRKFIFRTAQPWQRGKSLSFFNSHESNVVTHFVKQEQRSNSYPTKMMESTSKLNFTDSLLFRCST